MFERRDLLETSQTFQSLGNYRNLHKKVHETADFMFDVSQQLLCYSASIMLAGQEGETADQEVVGEEEMRRIVQLPQSRKTKRLSFLMALKVLSSGFQYGARTETG